MTYLINRFIVSVFIILATAGISPNQSIQGQTPVRQRLLNQLSVLLWKDASSEQISVNLRIHSGTAFDPLGKEGTAKILTEVMFPDNGTYEDFTEDLGGSLSITANHDYLQIDMTASKDKLITVLEILGSALNSPDITKETTENAKNLRLQKLLSDSSDPNYLASEETAARLYGEFPYGRNPEGTEDSIRAIDFADLIYFKDRFLTADNATLSISGDIDTRFAYLAARRLLGFWQKGNGKVPPNFTLPEPPDTAPLIINIDAASMRTQSFAVETVGRKDPEYYAAKVLSRVYTSRVGNSETTGLVYKCFLLRGYFYLNQSLPKLGLESLDGETTDRSNPLKEVLSQPVTEGEFRSALAAEISESKSRDLVNRWFDVDTYSLKSVSDELSKLQALKFKDVSAFALKTSKNPIVEVDVVPLEAAFPARGDDSEDPKDPS